MVTCSHPQRRGMGRLIYVVEDLNDVSRGRSTQHSFLHRLIVQSIQRRAQREGVAVREENPAFTSVIGRIKYAPRYNVTVHQAAALVVARRGLGYIEKLRGLKTVLFDAMEAREDSERVPGRRVHAWSLWKRLADLPQRQVARATRPRQSPETTGVGSGGTRRATERSPPPCDGGGGKTPTQVGVHA